MVNRYPFPKLLHCHSVVSEKTTSTAQTDDGRTTCTRLMRQLNIRNVPNDLKLTLEHLLFKSIIQTYIK